MASTLTLKVSKQSSRDVRGCLTEDIRFARNENMCVSAGRTATFHWLANPRANIFLSKEENGKITAVDESNISDDCKAFGKERKGRFYLNNSKSLMAQFGNCPDAKEVCACVPYTKHLKSMKKSASPKHFKVTEGSVW